MPSPSLSGMLHILPCVRLPNAAHSGIPPGQTFDYVVPINTSGQHGTFWAHAHASVGAFPIRFPAALTLFRVNMSTVFVLPSFYIPRTRHTSTTKNSLSFSAIGIIKNTTC